MHVFTGLRWLVTDKWVNVLTLSDRGNPNSDRQNVSRRLGEVFMHKQTLLQRLHYMADTYREKF